MAAKNHTKSSIQVTGAREHNLKNVSVEIPHARLTAFSGVSGAGKTTLAHNVIAQVAHRRLGRLTGDAAALGPSYEPVCDEITGLPACIEVLQEPIHGHRRSTVATYSGLLDLIAKLFLKHGETRTVDGNVAVPLDDEVIADWLWSNHRNANVALCRIETEVPVASARDLPATKFFYRERHTDWKEGSRATIKGQLPGKFSIALPQLDGQLIKRADLDRLVDSSEPARLWVIEKETFVEEGFHQVAKGEPKPFAPMSRRLYSFNAIGPGGGRCAVCAGLGVIEGISEAQVIENTDLPLLEGGLALPKSKGRFTHLGVLDDILRGILFQSGIQLDASWHEIPDPVREVILNGSRGEAIGELRLGESKPRSAKRSFPGLLPLILEKAKSKGHAGTVFQPWITETACYECQGSRYRRSSRLGSWRGLYFGELFSRFRIDDLAKALSKIGKSAGSVETDTIASIQDFLSIFEDLNLGHLPLNRTTSSLSGGEAQRLKLGLSLALRLTDSCYILDEPSRGLHYSDLSGIRRILGRLISDGNTTLMVEHHPTLISDADHVVQLGPGGGSEGGEVTFEGVPSKLPKVRKCSPNALPSEKPAKRLEASGLKLNNLKSVSFGIPVASLCAVVGVSGSGKSSAIFKGVVPSLKSHLEGAKTNQFCKLNVPSEIGFVEVVGQKLSTQNRRSIVATVLEIFDSLRNFYAALPDAKALSLDAKHFSFNSLGACEQCGGTGMSRDGFGEETESTCHTCGGSRFAGPALMVVHEFLGIADLLALPIVDLLNLSHPAIDGRTTTTLEVLVEIGLGHLSLGRSTPSLSAGERQRLALARFLARVEDQSETGLLVLDEPTAGLGIAAAQSVFEKLRELTQSFGHTVVVVEHKLELIPLSDWVLEFGPRGGPDGGEVVFEGSPSDLLSEGTETAQAIRKRGSGAKQTPRKRESSAIVGEEANWKDCCTTFEALAVRGKTHDEARISHPVKPAVRFESDRLPDDLRVGELLELLPWLRNAATPAVQEGVKFHSTSSDLQKATENTSFGFSPLAAQLRLGLAAPCDVKPALKKLQKLGFKEATVNGKTLPIGKISSVGDEIRSIRDFHVFCHADYPEELRRASLRWSEGLVLVFTERGAPEVHTTHFFDQSSGAIGEPLDSKFVGDCRSIRGQCRQCIGSGMLPSYPWDLIVKDEKQGIASDSFWTPEVLSGIRALRRSRILPETKFFSQQGIVDFEQPPGRMDPQTRLLFEHGIGWRRFLKPSARRTDREQDYYSWRGLHDYVYMALGKIKSKAHKKALKEGFQLKSCPACQGTGMGWEANHLSISGTSIGEVWSKWSIAKWKKDLGCKTTGLLCALDLGAGELTAADRFGDLSDSLKEALLFGLIPTAPLDSLTLVVSNARIKPSVETSLTKRFRMNLVTAV